MQNVWPGVALGAFLANATSGVALAGAALSAVGNTLEALAGAWLLRRTRFRPELAARLPALLDRVSLAHFEHPLDAYR